MSASTTPPEATEYAMTLRSPLPYDEAVERVTAALQEEGFGVLTEIDVRATLKKKLDVDFQRYVILGACNPQLAHRALTTDLQIGLLLPCNVVVHELAEGRSETTGGDRTMIAIADPLTLMDVSGHPDLPPIAREARERLDRVMEALAS